MNLHGHLAKQNDPKTAPPASLPEYLIGDKVSTDNKTRRGKV
jgi:hypothetical protein